VKSPMRLSRAKQGAGAAAEPELRAQLERGCASGNHFPAATQISLL
jgi:hypothetical protein